MKKIVSVSMMRDLEYQLFNESGMSPTIIIENVGIRAYDFVAKLFPNRTLIFLIGRGNNGADGLAMARQCFNNGYDVKAYMLFPEETYSEELEIQVALANTFSVPLSEIENDQDLELCLKTIKSRDAVVVDAILGIGFKSPLDDYLAEIIKKVNALKADVIALDIASGIDCDSGYVDDVAVNATVTLACELPKLGQYLFDGKRFSGEVYSLKIGFPEEFVSEAKGIDLLEFDDIEVPKKDKFAHKTTYGKILILAGSKEYSGAAIMSAHSALKAGGSMIFLKTFKDAVPLIAPRLRPEIIFDEITNFNDLNSFSSVLIGPGLGQSEDAVELVKLVLNEYKGNLVIDADALNIIALNDFASDLKNHAANNVVITPHLGEFSRLLRLDIDYLQENILGHVSEFADNFNCTVVLKDAVTLIADQNGEISVAAYPNPALSRAGSGDILAGTIAAFLNSGDAFSSCIKNAVLVHAKAAELLGQSRGVNAIGVTELLDFYPEILK